MLSPFITIQELKQLLESGQVTKEEVNSYFAQRCKKYNSQVNAAVEVFDSPVKATKVATLEP